MTPAEWIALASVALMLLGSVYMQGLNFGELKRGVKELIERDDRTQKRIDKVEEKVDDHAEKISEIRAHLQLPRQ